MDIEAGTEEARTIDEDKCMSKGADAEIDTPWIWTLALPEIWAELADTTELLTAWEEALTGVLEACIEEDPIGVLEARTEEEPTGVLDARTDDGTMKLDARTDETTELEARTEETTELDARTDDEMAELEARTDEADREATLEVLDMETEAELETDFFENVLNEPICQYFLQDSMGLRVSPVMSSVCMGQLEAA
jgi:hypothetical protein